jgi:hypothetical protein
VLGIEAYAKLLYDCGAEQITVFEKIYPHILEHADAVADWTSGTALVPYFERLSPDMKAAYEPPCPTARCSMVSGASCSPPPCQTANHTELNVYR